MHIHANDGPVGQSVPRLDARAKVMGAAQYSDDIRLPRMLHGAILGSALPHARITAIDVGAARALPGVHAVITGADFSGERLGLFVKDLYPLARESVRFLGDMVAAVAAEDPDIARRALQLIDVRYEELPAVMEIEAALAPGAPVLHPDYEKYFKLTTPGSRANVIGEYDLRQGDIDRAWAQCDVIVSGEYRVPAQQHAYMEPCAAVANVDVDGRLTIWASTQWIFGVQSAVASALGLPNAQVRVIAPAIGGGFGAKYDFTVEPVAAKLAQVTRRPVRLALSRDEDMSMVKSRHRGIVRMRTGARRDGTLLAREAEVLLDGGAYADESTSVLAFALNRAPGPYRIAHLHCHGKVVYTNRLRAGAYRGFGNPQVTFPGESQIDDIAARLGVDPIEIRIKNALRSGDPWFGGTTVEVGSLQTCLERVREACDWDRRRRAGADGRQRALGVAAIWHICGLGASGANVRLLDDGSVTLNTGAVDIGQGADTALAQICAGALGLPLARVNNTTPDTHGSPFNAATSGSRTTYMAGHSVAAAAAEVRGQILAHAGAMFECGTEDLELRPDGVVGVIGVPDKRITFREIAARALWESGGEIAGGHRWLYRPLDADPKRASGEGYAVGTNIFGAQVVEVEIDRATGQIHVLNAWSAHDVGRAINPREVAAQIEGGFVQGLGYALTEELLWDDGKLVNPTFMDYKIPGAADTPRSLQAIIVEEPDPRGPFGAKGIGEPPLVGVAPAIGNAVHAATGVRLTEIPMTPERVLAALESDAQTGA